MTFGNDTIRRALTILILIALGIACTGSLLFAVFGNYLARFPTSNF